MVPVDIDDLAAGVLLARRVQRRAARFAAVSPSRSWLSRPPFRRRLRLGVRRVRADARHDAPAFGVRGTTCAFRRAQHALLRVASPATFGPTHPTDPFSHPPGGVVPGMMKDGDYCAITAPLPFEHGQLASPRTHPSRGWSQYTALHLSAVMNSFAECSMLNRLCSRRRCGRPRSKAASREATDTSLCALRERLARAGSEFATLVSDIASRDAWDTGSSSDV